MDQNGPLAERDSAITPRLRQVVPLLQVSNMERSLAYYQEALGFDLLRAWPEKGPVKWAYLACNDVLFMLTIDLGTSDQAFIAEKGNGIVLYIMADHLDALYQDLSRRGAIIVQDIVTFGDRRQFSVGDADGYILAFSEPFGEQG